MLCSPPAELPTQCACFTASAGRQQAPNQSADWLVHNE
uniref:Uncharacterized protein n=1 Tax=Anguilla anguilla TaxID=7936 RepID=A0A0E9W9J3_ANGAN